MKKKCSISKGLFVMCLAFCCFALFGCSKNSSAPITEAPTANSADEASVDSFTVRNGSRFGMTPDEVIKIENQNGIEGISVIDFKQYRAESTEKEININPTRIAGYDNGELSYLFDNDQLKKISYTWQNKWSREYEDSRDFQVDDEKSFRMQLQNQYDTIYNSLAGKYEQIGSLSGQHEFKYVNLTENDNETSDFYGPAVYAKGTDSEKNYDIVAFSQFLAKDADNYVEIILSCYRYEFYSLEDELKQLQGAKIEPTSITYTLFVHYRNRAKNTIDAIVKDSNERKEQRESDL